MGWNLAQEHLLPQPHCQDTGTDPKPARAEHPIGTIFMWALLSLEKRNPFLEGNKAKFTGWSKQLKWSQAFRMQFPVSPFSS